MTPGETARVKDAFEAFLLAAQKAKPDHVNGAAFQGAVAALGWVLGADGYTEAFDAMLNEVKSLLGRKMTSFLKPQ